MNSELGMLLPFAAVMFVMWCGTRIVLRWIDRSRVSPVNAERRLHERSDRKTGSRKRSDILAFLLTLKFRPVTVLKPRASSAHAPS